MQTSAVKHHFLPSLFLSLFQIPTLHFLSFLQRQLPQSSLGFKVPKITKVKINLKKKKKKSVAKRSSQCPTCTWAQSFKGAAKNPPRCPWLGFSMLVVLSSPSCSHRRFCSSQDEAAGNWKGQRVLLLLPPEGTIGERRLEEAVVVVGRAAWVRWVSQGCVLHPPALSPGQAGGQTAPLCPVCALCLCWLC